MTNSTCRLAMSSEDSGDVLHPTPERINFYRLTTLLVAGGTEIMRQEFDRIHPPRTLMSALAGVQPTIKKAARLTKVQMDQLYPPPTGKPVQSRDFDITLLFALFRCMCGLTPPPTGWDALPADDKETLESDLARLKFYRNKLYAHVEGGRMEVGEGEFHQLWGTISRVLQRMVGRNDPSKMFAWRGHINKLKAEPLQSPEVLDILVGQLNDCHAAEMEEIRQLNRSVSNLSQAFSASLETLQDTVLQMTPKENAGSDGRTSVSGQQIGMAQNWTINNFIINVCGPAANPGTLAGVPFHGVPHTVPGLTPAVAQSNSGTAAFHSPDGSSGSSSSNFPMFEESSRAVRAQHSQSYPSLPQNRNGHDDYPFGSGSPGNPDDNDAINMRCSTPVDRNTPSRSSLPYRPQISRSGEWSGARAGTSQPLPYDPLNSPSVQSRWSSNADSSRSFVERSKSLASHWSKEDSNPDHSRSVGLKGGSYFDRYDRPDNSSSRLTPATSSNSFASHWSKEDSNPDHSRSVGPKGGSYYDRYDRPDNSSSRLTPATSSNSLTSHWSKEDSNPDHSRSVGLKGGSYFDRYDRPDNSSSRLTPATSSNSLASHWSKEDSDPDHSRSVGLKGGSYYDRYDRPDNSSSRLTPATSSNSLASHWSKEDSNPDHSRSVGPKGGLYYDHYDRLDSSSPSLTASTSSNSFLPHWPQREQFSRSADIKSPSGEVASPQPNRMQGRMSEAGNEEDEDFLELKSPENSEGKSRLLTLHYRAQFLEARLA